MFLFLRGLFGFTNHFWLTMLTDNELAEYQARQAELRAEHQARAKSPGADARRLAKPAPCHCHEPTATSPDIATAAASPDWSGPIRWISLAQLARDTLTLAGQLPPNLAGVAGIPRSGMLVAPILSTLLHLPLYEVTASGELRQLAHGSRADGSTFAGDRAGPMLVVDDTVYSGWAMQRVRNMVRGPAVFAAVYVRPSARGVVDFVGRELPSPHVLEWHVFNSPLMEGHAQDYRLRGGFAVDIDGLLCRDPHVPDADDGPGEECYRAWLQNAQPLFPVRTAKIPLAVSGRIERYRADTLAWFARWGIRVNELVLHPAATMAARNAAADVAALKGRAFAASPCSIFLESDRRQCAEIFSIAGKPVVCPTTAEVWQ